jgi:hypothetical protein
MVLTHQGTRACRGIAPCPIDTDPTRCGQALNLHDIERIFVMVIDETSYFLANFHLEALFTLLGHLPAICPAIEPKSILLFSAATFLRRNLMHLRGRVDMQTDLCYDATQHQ